MNDSVVIGELTWPEYARRVASGSTIFLPVGALEQHGHHMCMEVDVLLPTALCKAVARNVDGLVLPALAYGYKSQQKSGGEPGSVNLRTVSGVNTCILVAVSESVSHPLFNHICA